MTQETEKKIEKLFQDAKDEAVIHFTYELKVQLRIIKSKMKYDKINLISGMGTTCIDIMNKGVEYSSTDNNFPHEVFQEVNDFIQLMAGTYNIYPDNILV